VESPAAGVAAVGGDNFTNFYLPPRSFVIITAVPEPSTLSLAAIGLGLTALASSTRKAC
jgi:hypothetical protein